MRGILSDLSARTHAERNISILEGLSVSNTLSCHCDLIPSSLQCGDEGDLLVGVAPGEDLAVHDRLLDDVLLILRVHVVNLDI